jgi:hypothetical protein
MHVVFSSFACHVIRPLLDDPHVTTHQRGLEGTRDHVLGRRTYVMAPYQTVQLLAGRLSQG